MMQKNFIEELRWRRMLQDSMPGTEELVNKEMVTGYIGFDPTADSLGVGNLVQIMTLLHFQRCGHKPIALVGGATGMVGDPSGKSAERNLLSETVLQHNLDCQKKQLEKFLDFNCGENSAEIVNNYDWFKQISFLEFIRDIGKHITVNYMMSKDSVRNRLEREGEGMSFTEFTYQLVQGYDFYYLWKNRNVKLQMGGSDQWGNIVTGTELIGRKDGGKAWALVTPLIKKADGTKFGKTEGGNIWLDPKRTSPYQFYQFWFNASDEDVPNFMRIFSLKNREEIEALEAEHAKAPHQRLLQKELGKEITIRVHSERDFNLALAATEILFGGGTLETLSGLSDTDFADVFKDVKQAEVSRDILAAGIPLLDFLTANAALFPSKGEARRMVQGNGVSLNKQKVTDEKMLVDTGMLLNDRFILAQKGKKDYFLVKVV
ncbi:MAG: tyrosyl-tRNA synthetase [Bacteroidetes bacterium]|nr:MAG: tyrosyl-tRNA synthetase [Bacteroidota bacterium]